MVERVTSWLKSGDCRPWGSAWLAIAPLLALTACATGPAPTAAAARPVAPPPVAEAPDPRIFVYPARGQSPELLDRDRYECNAWAVKQSGFDPSLPSLPPRQRLRVVAAGPPDGTNTVAGAMGGAIVGAAVSRPREAGEGAVIGAVAGALLGANADAANQRRAEAEQQRIDRFEQQAMGRLDNQVRDYRRAITACMEGRGYTVK